MAKLKALPKALIVGAIVASIGFGVYKFLPKHTPKPVDDEDVVQVQEAPTPVPAQPVRSAPAPQPAEEDQAPTPQPAPQRDASTNRGLNAVLNAGK